MRVAEELRQADEARKNQADVAVRRAEVSGSLEWAGRLRGDQVTVHRDIAARLAGALLVARMRRRLLAREPEGFVLLRRNHDTVEELVVSLGPDAQATRTRVSMSAPQGMRRPFERVVREVFATRRVDSSW